MASDFSTSDNDLDPISGINVTPFVDVVLVLLVIFMVTAPIVLKDVLSVKLPKVASSDQKVAQTLGIVITRQGQVLLSGKPASEDTVALAVKEAKAKDPGATAIISADEDSRHGDVVKAIDWLKTAGLENFAVQIEHR